MTELTAKHDKESSSSSSSSSSSYSQCIFNMATTAASIAAPAAVAYFAAPYLSLATRLIFPAAYGMVIGTPSTLGYYGTYLPAREYVCTQVYNNAHVIAGVAYAGVQAAKKAAASITHTGFFSSSISSSNSEEQEIENEFIMV